MGLPAFSADGVSLTKRVHRIIGGDNGGGASPARDLAGKGPAAVVRPVASRQGLDVRATPSATPSPRSLDLILGRGPVMLG